MATPSQVENDTNTRAARSQVENDANTGAARSQVENDANTRAARSQVKNDATSSAAPKLERKRLRSARAWRSGASPEVGRKAIQIHNSARAATPWPRRSHSAHSTPDPKSSSSPSAAAGSRTESTTRTASLVVDRSGTKSQASSSGQAARLVGHWIVRRPPMGSAPVSELPSTAGRNANR